MRNYKRLIVLTLAVMLAVLPLAGCSSKPDSIGLPEEAEIQQSAISSLPDSFDKVNNVSYVMVYNPDLYNEFNDANNELATGDFDQNVVDTSAFRAGELPEELEAGIMPKSQGELMGDFNFDEIEPSENRAGIVVPPYEAGDTHFFFYINIGMDYRTGGTFVCRYAGDHCCVWTLQGENSISDEKANECGKKFDQEIYDREVEFFGEPRYAEDGGKVHLLLYDFKCVGMNVTLGYFYPVDIMFTSADASPLEALAYQLNLDHAILNVNTAAMNNPLFGQYVDSVMVHEFQHLIFQSSIMAQPKIRVSNVWLNEALSGYIENVFYPGTKAAHVLDMQNSRLIRHGQSLYNFGVEDGDIGVYGSVYLFAEFLKELGGDKVFHGIHDYLRTTSDEELTDDAALYEALGPEVVKMIDSAIVMPEGVTYANEQEEFTSKLTLAYYISLLNGEIANPAAFGTVDKMTLLYDELDGCNIQGGGRVLLATKGGKFQIPESADKGLVYIGFDKNFKPVTSIIGN